MHRNRKIWLLLLLALPFLAGAQNSNAYVTRLCRTGMASLRVQYAPEATGAEVGMAVTNPQRPFLVLSDDMVGDGQVLEISFDELSHTTHQYSYTLRHLNADWTPSDLQQTDYIRGFVQADITDYEHSFNTQQLYTHYRFTFPNEDMQPIVSGNYVLIVYEDGRQEAPMATVCVRVVDPRAKIKADVRTNTDIEFSGRYQQLDIDIETSGLKVLTPDEVRVVVEQNGRSDNSVVLPKPTYVEQHRLRWKNCRQLIFEGGQEYQHIDIASAYFKGQNVDEIIFDQRMYHAFLFPSEIRTERPYTAEYDANGQFVVNAERTDQDDTEADYMMVHWILPAAGPWLDGQIYLLGDAWQNRFTQENRLTYDYEHQAYVGSSYLKQGGYEWLYAFVPKGSRKATLERVEGSHWQTGNQYRIWVYYRPFGSRYDQLVGAGTP